MVIKKLFGKISRMGNKSTPKTKRSKKTSSGKFKNRFHKFYHLNKKRLNKERRSSYSKRANKGICVRCSKKVVRGIVFCTYHKAKQKEYNAKARAKKKSIS